MRFAVFCAVGFSSYLLESTLAHKRCEDWYVDPRSGSVSDPSARSRTIWGSQARATQQITTLKAGLYRPSHWSSTWTRPKSIRCEWVHHQKENKQNGVYIFASQAGIHTKTRNSRSKSIAKPTSEEMNTKNKQPAQHCLPPRSFFVLI